MHIETFSTSSDIFCSAVLSSACAVMMEGHSDRSSSLSADSGGLIDLCALDSDCKIGDSSQASVGEASCIFTAIG